ncbi:MAG: hypothetical protein QUU85_10385, partial [Candidatus Eisenbacteria bacterium]|nr:hypothetical protein [Candidatus Eisenbacteria bacterium]
MPQRGPSFFLAWRFTLLLAEGAAATPRWTYAIACSNVIVRPMRRAASNASDPISFSALASHPAVSYTHLTL